MAVDKIVLKKIVVGTPIKRVTSGAFSIDNISGVNTAFGTESDGSFLAFRTSTGNYEPTDLRGTSNILVNYDSNQGSYSFTLTNNDFSGHIVPDADITYDLGSAAAADHIISGMCAQAQQAGPRPANGHPERRWSYLC